MSIEGIRKIGIAGAGTMGSGIALILARRGYEVVVTDLSINLLEESRKLVDIFNQTLIDQGLMFVEEEEKIMSNIDYSLDKNSFSDSDLIIEAIVENMGIKQDFWAEVESIARPDAVFATNTSGLSINEISGKLSNKERFIGMHFWNPPHIIPLVEVIKGDHTSQDITLRMKALLEDIGKEPVIVQKDAPGFIGNRLQFAVFREALHMVQEGIGTIEDVDRAMRFGPGFRYPVLGPLETADFGGLDVFSHISSYLFKELSTMESPPETLIEKVSQNQLGIKTKKGFYDYSEGKDSTAIRRRDRMFLDMVKFIATNKNSVD